MYPVSGFLYDVENNWSVLIIEQNVFNFLMDMVDVVSCNASDGFYLVMKRSEWVFVGELKH